MSWEGRDPPTQTRCVSLEYLDELYAKDDARRELAAAVREAANAYGCYAGCTGALPGAPADGSGHTPVCRRIREALACM